MRKIKKPNVTIKPREVFYQLKRNRLLEGLDEATIEELLNKENQGKLVSPGFIYENFEAQILEEREELGNWPLGSTFSLAVATVGDAGFEEKIKNLAGNGTQAQKQRVLWAWAEVLLVKLVDLATALIGEEASQDASDAGPSLTLAANTHKRLLEFLLIRLNPQEKLGVQIVLDPTDNTQKLFPSLTKFWLVPWLKKTGVKS